MFQERQVRGKEAAFQIVQSKGSVLYHSDAQFILNFFFCITGYKRVSVANTVPPS